MLFNNLKRLADNYMQIWNANSEGLLDIYASPDLVVEYTHINPIKGVEDYKKFLQNTYQTFPDLKVNIMDIYPDKKQGNITVFWNYSGTHKKHPLFGVMPTGKKIAVNGMSFLQIKDKKVVLERGMIDNLSLLMQLNPQK